MNRFKYGLLRENGITLVGLIITVVVMLIIAGVSIYNGTESLNSTRLRGFYTQLEIVQKRVDDIAATNEMYINKDGHEINIKESGQSLTQNQKQKLQNILQAEKVDINNVNLEEFRYFTIQDLEEILDIREIEYNLFINFSKRLIVAEDGIVIDEKTYYILENSIYFTELNSQKNIGLIKSLKYSKPIKYIDDTYKVTITPDEVEGNLSKDGYIKYKLTTTKYWETSKDLTIVMEKDVEYNIKYIDDNNNIERIIKIQLESVEEGNVIENEDNNNDIFKVVEIEPEQESEEM